MRSYIKMSDAFNDEFHFADEGIDCDQYKIVFYSIFEVMNQGQHFKHIMEETEQNNKKYFKIRIKHLLCK